jgi:hypothetical protein
MDSSRGCGLIAEGTALADFVEEAAEGHFELGVGVVGAVFDLGADVGDAVLADLGQVMHLAEHFGFGRNVQLIDSGHAAGLRTLRGLHAAHFVRGGDRLGRVNVRATINIHCVFSLKWPAGSRNGLTRFSGHKMFLRWVFDGLEKHDPAQIIEQLLPTQRTLSGGGRFPNHVTQKSAGVALSVSGEPIHVLMRPGER